MKDAYFLTMLLMMALWIGWNIFFSIPKKIEQEVNRKVASFFKNKIQDIKALIQDQQVENSLKNLKHILILGNT